MRVVGRLKCKIVCWAGMPGRRAEVRLLSVSWKSGYVLIRGIDTGGSVTVHRSDDGGSTIATDNGCWCLMLGMMPELVVRR